MNKILIFATLIFLIASCNAQTHKNESLEKQDIDNTPPIYYGIPEMISAQDTSAGWTQNGQKILLTGTVYLRDGKTPAPDILIYYLTLRTPFLKNQKKAKEY